MDTFYDRTSNILIPSGQELTGITYYPSYGSTVSFVSRSNMFETQNGYYNSIPLSINSLDAQFNLRFDLNESGAAKLTNFIENKEGCNLFEFSDSSSFYKLLSGECDSYAINHINKRHYEVAISFSVDQAPSLFNWSGMNFINLTPEAWAEGQDYKKYDVVYFDNEIGNKLNNFYYCSGDNTSSDTNSPTGVNSAWTRSFFFEPDAGFQNDVQIKVDKVEFKNSFIQRMKTRNNLSQVQFSYKFSNLPTKQAKCIMHFLENKAGYRRFYHSPPSVYNRDKVFYCPNWDHTFQSYESHNITVNLIEDPLGIVPTGS